MTTSSPTSSMTGLPSSSQASTAAPSDARLQLAAVDRQQRRAADEGGAEVGAAAGREQPGVGAELLVDPVEALGRERGAGRADRLQPAEVAALAGVDAGLHAGGDVGGAGAEHRDPGPLGEVPEDAHVGMAGAAVVEDDRGAGEQAGDEEVPHHPAGGREPEEAVAGMGVDVEVELLQVLEQDAALALDDRLRQPGGAGGVEDPERVVEGDPLEVELGALAGVGELLPGHRVVEAAEVGVGIEVGKDDRAGQARHRRLQLGDHVAAVEVPAAVAVAVDREQDLGLDLGEAVDDAGRAEVGRAARPDRADAGRGEEGDDRLRDVREVGDDAVATLDPEGRAGRRPRRRPGRAARPS